MTWQNRFSGAFRTKNSSGSSNTIEPTEQENLETFVEVEGFGIAPMLRRQRSMPPKYDDVFPNSFDENNDPTPT
ncbi:MAG: hypothetical protein VXW13_10355, partial [SAR324 cluster bacterium]|nr:hypothetical protein [SAR324 cluster bacterium]